MKRMFWTLVLGVLAAGCNNGGGGNPMGPSGGGATVLLNENYDTGGTGTWFFPDPGIQGANDPSTGGAAKGSVKFYSSGLNATTFDHARIGLTTTATAATVNLAFKLNFANTSATDPVEMRLELSNVVAWRMAFFPNGSVSFNNLTFTCSSCPANNVWSTLQVVSNGQTTSTLKVGGTAQSGYYSYLTPAAGDGFGSIFHLMFGNCMDTAGSALWLDDLKITTP
jgi:hypothetical protein